jgi:sulfite exporter TauE/SafE
MLLASAALMGFLGGAHCIVMCGGVVAVTCSALPPARRGRPLAQIPHVLAYNAGRILSYAAAGAAAGALGALFVGFGPVERLRLGLRLAASAAMLAVGLSVSGLTGPLRWAERMGEPVWRRVAPLARRLVPVRSPGHALALGLLWGWMPCGLVYAALAAAATSGAPGAGALTMAAFGVGTLPTLVTMGTAAALVARAARARLVRRMAGLTIVAFGVVQAALVGRAWIDAHPAGSSACCVCPRGG